MKKDESGKFRRRKKNFSSVPNSVARNKGLSFKAKGLYLMIESYIDIPNFELHKWYLISQCKEGKKAFDSAWKELKDAGYLKIYRVPSGKSGKFVYEYELLDKANTVTPQLVNLNRSHEKITKKCGSEKQPENDGNETDDFEPKNTEGSRTFCPGTVEVENDKKGSDHTPQNGVYGRQNNEYYQSYLSQDSIYDNIDAIPQETEAPYPPFRTICSKDDMLNGGSINNTELNNTELNNKYRGYKSISLSLKAEAHKTDGQTDEIRNKLKEQIDYDYFEDNFPEDITGINALIDCMTEMMTSPCTKINGSMQLRSVLKPYIDKADSENIRGFLEHMRGKPMRDIKNVTAYFRSSLINYLRDEQFVLQTV